MTTAETRWLGTAEQAAWRGYINGSQRLSARLEQDLKVHGTTHDDYRILVLLSEAPDDRLRMAELAELSVESRSRLSHHVARLERRGLVARQSCPSDGRGQFAVLLPAGRHLIEAVAPHHVEGVRAWFLDHLEPDEMAVIGTAFARIDAALCARADHGAGSDDGPDPEPA
ncbi:MAG: MarR family winged helix-turn-helix transcriptional regulator [Acidimicrobiales bacterium]